MIYGGRVDSSARTDIMIIIEILTTCYTVTVAGDGPSNGPSWHAIRTRAAAHHSSGARSTTSVHSVVEWLRACRFNVVNTTHTAHDHSLAVPRRRCVVISGEVSHHATNAIS